MWKKILIATAAPVILILLLFVLVSNGRIRTYTFKRNYAKVHYTLTRSVTNPGIYQIKVHQGKLYGCSLRAIAKLDENTLKPEYVTEAIPQNIIGWGFHHDTLLAGISNTGAIYYVDEHGRFQSYRVFPFHVNKVFFVDDSLVLLKAYDTSLINYAFYQFNLNHKTLTRLVDNLPKANDGGFAEDGEFIDLGKDVVHYRQNMGGFSVISKKGWTFSRVYRTLEANTALPAVIHFAEKGFRLDKKFIRTNLTSCAFDNDLFLFSNAYNKMEYYGGGYKSENPVDVYDGKTFEYKYSFSFPKNTYTNGSLMGAVQFNRQLLLIYLRKIETFQL